MGSVGFSVNINCTLLVDGRGGLYLPFQYPQGDCSLPLQQFLPARKLEYQRNLDNYSQQR